MNFTSQICTTKEQSERLLALGLKVDTADMHYFHTVGFEGNDLWLPSLSPYENVVKAPNYGEKTKIYIKSHTIPAWSLHRLIEILDIWYLDLDFHNFANAYEQVISYFEERVKGGFINKDYLKE